MATLKMYGQLDEVDGVIIALDDEMGALFNDKGEQQGPVFYGNSVAELKKKATEYFKHAGGHDVWPAGLELRIRR